MAERERVTVLKDLYDADGTGDGFFVACPLRCGKWLHVSVKDDEYQTARAEIAHMLRKHILFAWVLPIRYAVRALLKRMD